MFYGKKFATGFSLIELILVISLIILLAGAGIPIASGSLRTNQMLETREGLTSFLRSAQVNALAGKADCAWGVYQEPNAIHLFCGDSYAQQQAALEQTWAVPASVNASTAEIVFSQADGLPAAAQNFSLSDGEKTYLITVNEWGVVDVD